jgi:hypothetical protein
MAAKPERNVFADALVLDATAGRKKKISTTRRLGARPQR